MAFTALISGGVLDRFPDLRIVFLEAGCQWVPFILERVHHRYKNQGSTLRKFLPQTAPIQKLPVMEYIKRGNIFFSTEVEDEILPNVLNLVGEGQVIFGSDMPHGDRERCAARMLQERKRYQRVCESEYPRQKSRAALRHRVGKTSDLAALDGYILHDFARGYLSLSKNFSFSNSCIKLRSTKFSGFASVRF